MSYRTMPLLGGPLSDGAYRVFLPDILKDQFEAVDPNRCDEPVHWFLNAAQEEIHEKIQKQIHSTRRKRNQRK